MFNMSNPKSNDIFSCGNVCVFLTFFALNISAPFVNEVPKNIRCVTSILGTFINVIVSPIAVDLSTVKHTLKSFLHPTLMKVIV